MKYLSASYCTAVHVVVVVVVVVVSGFWSRSQSLIQSGSFYSPTELPVLHRDTGRVWGQARKLLRRGSTGGRCRTTWEPNTHSPSDPTRVTLPPCICHHIEVLEVLPGDSKLRHDIFSEDLIQPPPPPTHTHTHTHTHQRTHTHRWTSALRITSPTHVLVFLQIRWIWGSGSCLFSSLCRQGVSRLESPTPSSPHRGIGSLLSLLQYESSGRVYLCYSGTPKLNSTVLFDFA